MTQTIQGTLCTVLLRPCAVSGMSAVCLSPSHPLTMSSIHLMQHFRWGKTPLAAPLKMKVDP